MKSSIKKSNHICLKEVKSLIKLAFFYEKICNTIALQTKIVYNLNIWQQKS